MGPMRPFPIDVPADVSQALRRARISVGLSQNAASKFAGKISQGDISAYERGAHMPDVHRLVRLLRAYRMRLMVVPNGLQMVFIRAGSALEAEVRHAVWEREQAQLRAASLKEQLEAANERIGLLQAALRDRAAMRRGSGGR